MNDAVSACAVLLCGICSTDSDVNSISSPANPAFGIVAGRWYNVLLFLAPHGV